MQTFEPDWEIVRVHKPYRLIDAESYERWYRRAPGRELPVGYYVVTWPEPVAVRRFDENACFEGPFRNRNEAEARVERRPVRLPTPGAGDNRHTSPA